MDQLSYRGYGICHDPDSGMRRLDRAEWIWGRECQEEKYRIREILDGYKTRLVILDFGGGTDGKGVEEAIGKFWDSSGD